MAQVVIARFYDNNGNANGGEYHYFVPPGDMPKPGDVILTSIAVDMNEIGDMPNVTTVRCAIVSGVVESSPKANKFYLMHISKQEILERREAQRQRLEQAKELQAIQKRLDEMLATQNKMAQYEQLATVNPEAALLVKKLRGEDVSQGVELPAFEGEETKMRLNLKRPTLSRVTARRRTTQATK